MYAEVTRRSHLMHLVAVAGSVTALSNRVSQVTGPASFTASAVAGSAADAGEHSYLT